MGGIGETVGLSKGAPMNGPIVHGRGGVRRPPPQYPTRTFPMEVTASMWTTAMERIPSVSSRTDPALER